MLNRRYEPQQSYEEIGGKSKFSIIESLRAVAQNGPEA
jgi:hypothetical protein